jgi:hypothetical protein
MCGGFPRSSGSRAYQIDESAWGWSRPPPGSLFPLLPASARHSRDRWSSCEPSLRCFRCVSPDPTDAQCCARAACPICPWANESAFDRQGSDACAKYPAIPVIRSACSRPCDTPILVPPRRAWCARRRQPCGFFLSVPAFGSRGKNVRQRQPHSRIGGLQVSLRTDCDRHNSRRQLQPLVRTELLVFR